MIPMVHFAAAVLHNSLGEYREALEATELAVQHDDLGLGSYALAQRVKPLPASANTTSGPSAASAPRASRGGRHRPGAGHRRAVARPAGQRARGGGPVPGSDRAPRTQRHRDAARARPPDLRGMVATENRRNDAREHLRRAHDIFSRVRSDGFAARARGELLALGDAVPKPDAGRSETLTSQESFIARLARDGHTNQEIGTRLFISTRTVEWHMSKILNKLDIKSRRGLRAALADSALSCTTLRFEVIWFMASVVKPQSTASVFAIMPSAPRSMQLANSSAPRNAVRRGSSASG